MFSDGPLQLSTNLPSTVLGMTLEPSGSSLKVHVTLKHQRAIQYRAG